MYSKTNALGVKIYKTAISLVVLSLMLTPFASFASKQETRIIKEPRGAVSPETTQGLATPTVTSQQNKGEIQQVKQGSQVGQEEANGNNEDGQVQKQLRDEGESQASDKATQRRNRVANAVQEMLRVAERNGGVGDQIRTIAQNQNENQEKIETEMEEVKNRGQLKKFFFGPDYKNLNSIEERLLNHDEKIGELKELASEISDVADLETLEEQIKVMEEIKTELEKEVTIESEGFSLFGWLSKMLAK